MSSSRSSPWVRDSSRWTFGSRAKTAGSDGMRPSMWANRKYPRTACIIVTTEGVHQPPVAELADIELDMGSLDPGQWSSPLLSHQANHCLSW